MFPDFSIEDLPSANNMWKCVLVRKSFQTWHPITHQAKNRHNINNFYAPNQQLKNIGTNDILRVSICQ